MDIGYIKLFRELQSWKYYHKADYLKVWIHLLLRANFKDSYNEYAQLIKRGQVDTGRKQLSSELKMNESKVERILKCLENEHQIEQQKTNRNRIITIKEYDLYQSGEQQNEQQVNNKRTTSEQQVNTLKEDKERKEDKENNNVVELKLNQSVNTIFNFYKWVLDRPKYQLTETKRKKIKDRLKEKPIQLIPWAVDRQTELLCSICSVALNDWNMGRTEKSNRTYIELDKHCLRSVDQVEQRLNYLVENPEKLKKTKELLVKEGFLDVNKIQQV